MLILLWLIRIDKSLRFLKQITNKTGRNMMSREKDDAGKTFFTI